MKQASKIGLGLAAVGLIAATIGVGYYIVGHGHAANLTAQTAQSAEAFVDSIGLNIHTGAGGQYASPSSWIPLLQQLGVRHVRDGWIATRVSQQKPFYNFKAGWSWG